MKKIVTSIIISSIILFSAYYFWDNRYVRLYPVTIERDEFVIKIDTIPINFYKNMKFVLHNYDEDYIIKDSLILIRHKRMNDLELIYNYTKKAQDSIWLSKIKSK